jgi:transcriptional regulator GlxA family with amidase domain
MVRPDRRIVDNENVVLSAGDSAGIDMSLHVVTRLVGAGVARETARYMGYEGDWELSVAAASA